MRRVTLVSLGSWTMSAVPPNRDPRYLQASLQRTLVVEALRQLIRWPRLALRVYRLPCILRRARRVSFFALEMVSELAPAGVGDWMTLIGGCAVVKPATPDPDGLTSVVGGGGVDTATGLGFETLTITESSTIRPSDVKALTVRTCGPLVNWRVSHSQPHGYTIWLSLRRPST